MENFFSCCLILLQETDLILKMKGCQELYARWQAGESFDWQPHREIVSIPLPGRPTRPSLVQPFAVPKRKMTPGEGHASLIHALAHIEFNAVNLALDACYRFQQLPRQFHADWLEVTVDEVYHFNLLAEYLQELGFSYGDFSAHNGLWEMALKTEHDPLARMGMVPRVLEARGIDAVPEMQHKLARLNDSRGIAILAIIHQDEIKHVQFGDKWFKYLCAQRQLAISDTFFALIEEYQAPKIRGPFNRVDRQKAGFSPEELDRLQAQGAHSA